MAGKFHTEGADFIGKVVFTEQESVPASYFVGLAKDASLPDTATVASIDECDAAGYARQTIASDAVDFTIGAHGTNDRKATAVQQEFTFTAAGDAVNMWFLTDLTDDTGFLIASGPLDNAPITPGASVTIKLNLDLRLIQ